MFAWLLQQYDFPKHMIWKLDCDMHYIFFQYLSIHNRENGIAYNRLALPTDKETAIP